MGRVESMCSLPILSSECALIKCRKGTVDNTPVDNTPMDLFIRRPICMFEARAHARYEPFHVAA
jgi:hypothetical protein